MRWAYRKYRLSVINTTDDSELFLWENWKRLMPSLDALVHLTTSQAYIRSSQSYEFENRWLGFGRMKWSEESNMHWTKKYRDIGSGKKKLTFHSTDIWAPDWNSVYKESIPPDVYVHLYYYPEIAKIRTGLIIALPRSLYKKNSTVVDLALQTIAKEIPGSTITALTRYWQPMWRIGNRIEDMNPQELQEIIEKHAIL